MPLHQCRNVAVLSTTQQIAFPMTRNRSVFGLRRPFANRNGVDDPAMSVNGWVSRAAYAPLRSQVAYQLSFQHSPSLNEQATVNGFVGHAHARVVGIPEIGRAHV